MTRRIKESKKVKMTTLQFLEAIRIYCEDHGLEGITIADDMLICKELSISIIEEGVYGLTLNDIFSTSYLIEVARDILNYSEFVLEEEVVLMECMASLFDEEGDCIGSVFESEYTKEFIINEDSKEEVDKRINDSEIHMCEDCKEKHIEHLIKDHGLNREEAEKGFVEIKRSEN
jgi:hypothetical protein